MISRMSRRGFLQLCAAASALHPSLARAQAPRKGGTLRVGFYIEAATMDPHFSGSKIDRQVYHNIYEPLVTLDVKLGIKPGLAERSEEHTSELQSHSDLVCRLLREKKDGSGRP